MPSRKPKPSLLGTYLKELRDRKGVSLRDVEEGTGVSNAYLSQLESGARQSQKLPTPEVLHKLAAYYNVTMKEILARAGYLEDTEVSDTLEQRIEKAYQFVISHPDFKHGTRITGKPTLEMKRFIVEMYEKLKKKKIL